MTAKALILIWEDMVWDLTPFFEEGIGPRFVKVEDDSEGIDLDLVSQNCGPHKRAERYRPPPSFLVVFHTFLSIMPMTHTF